ncbi:MAG: hypothetical protein V3U54_08790 [Thermodesulfobacteriota bacterium]
MVKKELIEYYDAIFKNFLEKRFKFFEDEKIKPKGLDDTESPDTAWQRRVDELYMIGELYIHGSLSCRTLTKMIQRYTVLQNLELIEVVDKLNTLREETDEFRRIKDRLLHGQT